MGPPGQYAFSFLMKRHLYGSTEQCHVTMWWQWDGFFDPHFGRLKSPWRQISRQGGKTHPFHELWGPVVHRKERLSWAKTFMPFGFLTVAVTWPAASRSSCSNSWPRWSMYLGPVSQNEPFLTLLLSRKENRSWDRPSPASRRGRPCLKGPITMGILILDSSLQSG